MYEDLNAEGFPCTRKEAKEIYYNYCKSYKTGVDYLRSMGKLAIKQGYVTNLNGRRRYWNLPDPQNTEKYKHGKNDPRYIARLAAIEREGGNCCIQSVNSDITKESMTRIRKYRKQNNIRSSFINQVYDEIVTKTHKDDTESFHPVKQKIMTDVSAIWLKNVPMEVDGDILPYWHKG